MGLLRAMTGELPSLEDAHGTSTLALTSLFQD